MDGSRRVAGCRDGYVHGGRSLRAAPHWASGRGAARPAPACAVAPAYSRRTRHPHGRRGPRTRGDRLPAPLGGLHATVAIVAGFHSRQPAPGAADGDGGVGGAKTLDPG